MNTPLIAQAAALLMEILRQKLPTPCSLDELEQAAHRCALEIARVALQQRGQEVVEAAEATPAPCACGGQPQAEQRRWRTLLAFPGLLRLRLRRFRCPACGQWSSPGATALGLGAKQRLTRAVTELLGQYGVAWSFAVAAQLVQRVLPGLVVSAKTVERCVGRCGRAVLAQQDTAAALAQSEPAAVAGSGVSLANPQRPYVTLDGVLVRARSAKGWLEIQVGSLWSAWVDRANRAHPRREISDRTLVARAQGWEAMGQQVWRLLVERGAIGASDPEIVVLGDGANGIRSVWEQHLPPCLAVLDPWHLWEKVKERGREVLGRGPATMAACQEVYGQLKGGAVNAAVALIRGWEARSDWAKQRQERLIGYLERNRDIIRDYERLRAAGYMVGAGLMEKANDMVVVPRMKNGKMHWSRTGATMVAALRAHLLSDPDATFLPL